ncbi:MAG: methenyltetrahydromethanopterin cyclohydrolase [Methanocellales archaeon]
MLSVNKGAFKAVKELLNNPQEYGVLVEKLPCGATVIDTGLKAPGGYLAGIRVSEICMGGYGTASLSYMKYGELDLPTVVVTTDHPAISLLAAQFAGWNIKTADGKFFAIGSGPARALAKKPKKLFEKIKYSDISDIAIAVLETKEKPPDEAALIVAQQCNVKPENVYLVLSPTASVAGAVQIAARIVETGLFRLEVLGFDPLKVLFGAGYAPVMPTHPDADKAMGMANDALFYGGVTYYTVDFDDDAKLAELISKCPSSNARDYGKPFYEIYKAAGFDFYKIDNALFAPAALSATNIKTGKTYSAGRINPEVLKNSIASA